MAVRKTELYTSLWHSCDELRGSMDASQYKDYVLVLLFIKYVSDKAASGTHALLQIPAGASFADLVALRGDRDIGAKMNGIVALLAEKNDLCGVIDVANWDDADKLGKGQDRVDRLSNLVKIFNHPALDFRDNHAEGDDLLGDAYEYLMCHFAAESGKSKGQFYTPAEVSRVLAKVAGLGAATGAEQTIHDPTCGSGSLLLKAHDEAKEATGYDLAVYGQEMDQATHALARMNLILHGCTAGTLRQDNTLSTPHFTQAQNGRLQTFDFVLANPPFSTKAWAHGFDPQLDPYGRFDLGVPPPKNGDYAFLLHCLACLNSTGRGAVILPHGVLFRTGAEAGIRRALVERGLIQGIIGLPANLFYGTGIPACILVLDRAGASKRREIFMIDAAKGFAKDGNKNRLRAQDMHKIVDVFTRELEVERYARKVPVTEIAAAKNDYNLNLPRYIDTHEPQDLQDIGGHLHGGVPDRDLNALDAYWKVMPGLRGTLFAPPAPPGYSHLRVPGEAVKAHILGHPEFLAWHGRCSALFMRWRADAAPRLRALCQGESVQVLLHALAEDLLQAFLTAELLDAYDLYQHLMDYAATTLQDDASLIASVGWHQAAKPRPVVTDRRTKDRGDFTRRKISFRSDLIPLSLLVSRYFHAEQQAVDALDAEAAALAQSLEDLLETHEGDEGLLAGAKNDRDKVTRVSVVARLAALSHGDDDGFAEAEGALLRECLALMERQTAIADAKKRAQQSLLATAAQKYETLDEAAVKALVVEHKWLPAIDRAVQAELNRVSHKVTQRVRELADRYADPLPALALEVDALSAKVRGHLHRMGFAWN